MALCLVACRAETSDTSSSTTSAASAGVPVQEFQIVFEPGNHWGGYGAGMVGESAIGTNGARYYLTGAASEYGDSPEAIHTTADADSSLRLVYAQDGIWDGWYYETESGPGPIPHKLVNFDRVEAQYRIDGGPIETVTLAPYQTELTGGPAALLHIPEDAAGKTLEYWFRITGSDGKTYWESRNAKNYHVEITPKGSTTLTGVHFP
jgi:hypothetical protein